MITLQHMKVFSNDNQLFCDYSKCTDSQQFLYRILDTGHIQAMVYEKKVHNFTVNEGFASKILNE